MLKTLVVAAMTLSVLSACGGEDSAGTADPAPPQDYTSAQLEDALPELADVPDASKITLRCPDPKIEACEEPEVEGTQAYALVALDLASDDSADPEWKGFASVGARLLTGPTAAALALEGERTRVAETNGEFKTEAEDIGGGSYNPGLVGTGSTEKTAVDGWSGLIHQRRLAFINLSGSTSDGKVQDAQIFLKRGKVLLTFSASVPAEASGAQSAERRARKLASDYLARLG